MGWNWKKWAADKGLQKWFRRDNFLILILTGILLVIIALPTKETGEKAGDGDGQSALQKMLEGTAGDAAQRTDRNAAQSTAQGTANETARRADSGDGEEAYAASLEGRLTEILSQMADVGQVKVMITLKSSRELVVEKEQPVSRSSTHENDSLGGSRTVSGVDSGESTVYRTDGSLSEPYVIKTLSPQIEGVLIVAEGAGQGTVSRTIAEIAQALFGIEAHKVKVVRMEGTRQPQAEKLLQTSP